jgi:hypothetical protein
VYGARKEITDMNASHIDQPRFLPHHRFALPRYRVCLHSTGSDQTRRVTHTDSAEEAVREFLQYGPLADGSDLYVWDREKKEIVARIEWIDEPTTFGSTIRVRTNHFYDHALADVARHLCERVEIRHAIVQGVAI